MSLVALDLPVVPLSVVLKGTSACILSWTRTCTDMLTSPTDATICDLPKQGGDVEALARLVLRHLLARLASYCSRLFADALKVGISELREDDQTRISQYARTWLPG